MQYFLAIYTLLFILISIVMFYILIASMVNFGVSIHLIPMTILFIYLLKTMWNVLKLTSNLTSDFDKCYKRKTYICTDGIDIGEAFTAGVEYVPISDYTGGVIFINDMGEKHYMPYYFLEVHFILAVNTN